jgi:hypothetical protein
MQDKIVVTYTLPNWLITKIMEEVKRNDDGFRSDVSKSG